MVDKLDVWLRCRNNRLGGQVYSAFLQAHFCQIYFERRWEVIKLGLSCHQYVT